MNDYKLTVISTDRAAMAAIKGVATLTEMTISLADGTHEATIALDGLTRMISRSNAALEKVRQRAILHNHGRARKVSFKRPSPQLSRKELDKIYDKAFGGL